MGQNMVGISTKLRLISISALLSLMPVVIVRAQTTTGDSLPKDAGVPSATAPGSELNLLDMKLDDLAKQNVVVPGMSTEVSTVERQKGTIGRSPNAVFVITNEMIKRSGARDIPEALRMAPGIEVARINSSTWAISARGFNDRLANHLLVQIDGRIIYQATYGGVWWHQNDVVLQDVERIEVVRGPGTTMWGSNAVNGVINIITKSTIDTQGALVQAGGGVGNEREFITGRYGGQINNNTTYRIYTQQSDYDNSFSRTGGVDEWNKQRAGFRVDSTLANNETVMLQGELFDGNGLEQLKNIPRPTFPFSETLIDENLFSGGNIVLRYGRIIDEDTSWQFQTHYDSYHQAYTELSSEKRSTYDFDFQYQFSPAVNHHVITGFNYRNSENTNFPNFVIHFDPNSLTTEWASVFAQDTITLEEDRWYFTLGARLEHYAFGGLQPEPTARLLYHPSERQSVWGAVSLASRYPSRIESQFNAKLGLDPNNPVYLNVLGNENLLAERTLAYELGYRAAPTDNFTWDIAGFINDNYDLQNQIPGAPIVGPNETLIPIRLGNDGRALTYGVELASTVNMNEDWRIFTSYTVFETDAQSDAGSILLSTPNNQVYLRSSWDLGERTQFDLIGRYVDRLRTGVPSYTEMDARLGWQATKNMEFSFVGRNLLDSHHPEFIDSLYIAPTEVRRNWYAMVTWVY
jgi:iron complex outermembrane recepter protein